MSAINKENKCSHCYINQQECTCLKCEHCDISIHLCECCHYCNCSPELCYCDICEGCDQLTEDCECNNDGCGCGECEDCAYNLGGVIPDSLREYADSIQKNGFEYVNSGDFRNVYLRGKVVIKVPRVGDGIVDNMIEARAWRKYRNRPTPIGIYLAPCRLLSNGCLMMRKVEFDYDREQFPLPEWAKRIDSMQVALYRNQFVSYDYALSIIEREQWEQEMKVSSDFFNRNPYWKNKLKEFLDEKAVE